MVDRVHSLRKAKKPATTYYWGPHTRLPVVFMVHPSVHDWPHTCAQIIAIYRVPNPIYRSRWTRVDRPTDNYR